MIVEEVLPWLVTTKLHTLEFGNFEAVHRYAADKSDMDAEAAVDARAVKTHEDAELG